MSSEAMAINEMNLARIRLLKHKHDGGEQLKDKQIDFLVSTALDGIKVNKIILLAGPTEKGL